MALLAGNETAAKKYHSSFLAERLWVCQFTSVAGGTIEKIKAFTSSIVGEGAVFFSIYEDTANKPKTLLSWKERTTKPGKEEWYEITELNKTGGTGSFTLQPSTKYWFGILGITGAGGWSQREEAGKVFKANSTHSKPEEDTWVTEETGGPFDFQLIGTLSGKSLGMML